MAILQMQRLSICAMKKDRKAILEQLQVWGVMEVNTSITDEEFLKKMDTSDARQQFEKNAALADKALEVLGEYVPEKTSMLSGLAGKDLVDKNDYETVMLRKEEILKKVNAVIALQKTVAEQNAAIQKREVQAEALTPWLDLDVPMNYRGTSSTSIIIGALNSVMDLNQIYAAIAAGAPELEAIDIQIISTDRDQTYIAAACRKKESARMEEILRSIGFSRPSFIVTKVPSEQKKQLEDEINSLQEEIARKESSIREYGKDRKEIQIFSDYFRARSQKYEVLGEVLQSKRTFLISGYVPSKLVPEITQKLTEKYDAVIDAEDLKEDEETPILLQNGKVASSVEGVVSSFGLPLASELDPSKLVSITYIFLFGLMLSDAAYGLIVTLACFILVKKFPRMSDGMNKAIRMFMYCGLSTMFWGIMFGGYFGDVINVVSRVFFGHEVGIPPVWFAPLDNPMKLLIYCMAFGVIHLFLGLGIKGYMLIRDKKYVDFFCDVVLWYCLLIGLLLMLIPSEIFASIAQATIVFPPAVNMLAKALAIIGAVGLLLMSGRANKNVALRIALGAYDLYNITGWLSDVLSYSRLLALGLATGVIASVVNQMGSMAGKSVFGVILFIVVFIGGHIFNIAINLLGAYVHTNRLQFVEFFGKFYEGGGRAFNPFKANTKYVDIKEETYL